MEDASRPLSKALTPLSVNPEADDSAEDVGKLMSPSDTVLTSPEHVTHCHSSVPRIAKGLSEKAIAVTMPQLGLPCVCDARTPQQIDSTGHGSAPGDAVMRQCLLMELRQSLTEFSAEVSRVLRDGLVHVWDVQQGASSDASESEGDVQGSDGKAPVRCRRHMPPSSAGMSCCQMATCSGMFDVQMHHAFTESGPADHHTGHCLHASTPPEWDRPLKLRQRCAVIRVNFDVRVCRGAVGVGGCGAARCQGNHCFPRLFQQVTLCRPAEGTTQTSDHETEQAPGEVKSRGSGSAMVVPPFYLILRELLLMAQNTAEAMARDDVDVFSAQNPAQTVRMCSLMIRDCFDRLLLVLERSCRNIKGGDLSRNAGVHAYILAVTQLNVLVDTAMEALSLAVSSARQISSTAPGAAAVLSEYAQTLRGLLQCVSEQCGRAVYLYRLRLDWYLRAVWPNFITRPDYFWRQPIGSRMASDATKPTAPQHGDERKQDSSGEGKDSDSAGFDEKGCVMNTVQSVRSLFSVVGVDVHETLKSLDMQHEAMTQHAKTTDHARLAPTRPAPSNGDAVGAEDGLHELSPRDETMKTSGDQSGFRVTKMSAPPPPPLSEDPDLDDLLEGITADKLRAFVTDTTPTLTPSTTQQEQHARAASFAGASEGKREGGRGFMRAQSGDVRAFSKFSSYIGCEQRDLTAHRSVWTQLLQATESFTVSPFVPVLLRSVFGPLFATYNSTTVAVRAANARHDSGGASSFHLSAVHLFNNIHQSLSELVQITLGLTLRSLEAWLVGLGGAGSQSENAVSLLQHVDQCFRYMSRTRREFDRGWKRVLRAASVHSAQLPSHSDWCLPLSQVRGDAGYQQADLLTVPHTPDRRVAAGLTPVPSFRARPPPTAQRQLDAVWYGSVARAADIPLSPGLLDPETTRQTVFFVNGGGAHQLLNDICALGGSVALWIPGVNGVHAINPLCDMLADNLPTTLRQVSHTFRSWYHEWTRLQAAVPVCARMLHVLNVFMCAEAYLGGKLRRTVAEQCSRLAVRRANSLPEDGEMHPRMSSGSFQASLSSSQVVSGEDGVLDKVQLHLPKSSVNTRQTLQLAAQTMTQMTVASCLDRARSVAARGLNEELHSGGDVSRWYRIWCPSFVE